MKDPALDSVVIHASISRRQYFFSTDHCQKSHAPDTYPGEDFVPTTFYLPHSVVPRPSLPSGIVATVQDVITIYCVGETEMLNPDPKFQP